MSEVKHKYILCPRCELNYIEEHEGYCKVCKAEMGLIDSGILIPDEDELGGEKLCPICKVNYIGEDLLPLQARKRSQGSRRKKRRGLG